MRISKHFAFRTCRENTLNICPLSTADFFSVRTNVVSTTIPFEDNIIISVLINVSAENIDKMSVEKELIVSNTHSHPEPKANESRGKSSNMKSNEETSFSSVPSNNELINSLKVPSVDESLNSDIVKKFRLADNDELCDEELVNALINGTKNLNKNNYSRLIKMFERSKMQFDHFDTFITQKIIGVFNKKEVLGDIRFKIQLLENREKLWQEKYTVICREINEFKSRHKIHMSEVTADKFAKPHLTKRTKGLKAFVSQETQGSQIPSSSKSTMESSSPVIHKPSNVRHKKVLDTIDLTGSNDIIDLIDLTNGLNTEHIPNKIIKCSTINKHISTETSSQQ